MGLEHKYRKSMAEHWCLRLKTALPEQSNFDGIITHIKRGFVVLCEEEDFAFDGIVILPKRVIKGCRDNKYEKCCNAIVRQNGAIKKLRVPKWLDDCNTIKDMLVELKTREIWPGVDMLVGNGADTAYYLGPIMHVGTGTFSLKCYDAAGEWEEVYELSNEDICCIGFDSNYTKSFNAYMRSKNKS